MPYFVVVTKGGDPTPEEAAIRSACATAAATLAAQMTDTTVRRVPSSTRSDGAPAVYKLQSCAYDTGEKQRGPWGQLMARHLFLTCLMRAEGEHDATWVVIGRADGADVRAVNFGTNVPKVATLDQMTAFLAEFDLLDGTGGVAQRRVQVPNPLAPDRVDAAVALALELRPSAGGLE